MGGFVQQETAFIVRNGELRNKTASHLIGSAPMTPRVALSRLG
jgi:hypothetical protein